ncbi:hypothetical protein SmJEL517_g05001 [Synchytrium microbalum]|uniref:C2H2-type domain-containing protein n=1 Tax=Synchytrium microbalum TaxID=1806994 RepID=A0A507BNV0_9FUNG|nr:uncharacterized protein SmJEL517_g05001 [Synchytrium microbalum]TPX31730.1 hypothetical protein SmJEL517_g05001 [Synchytrium microbalum]
MNAPDAWGNRYLNNLGQTKKKWQITSHIEFWPDWDGKAKIDYRVVAKCLHCSKYWKHPTFRETGNEGLGKLGKLPQYNISNILVHLSHVHAINPDSGEEAESEGSMITAPKPLPIPAAPPIQAYTYQQPVPSAFYTPSLPSSRVSVPESRVPLSMPSKLPDWAHYKDRESSTKNFFEFFKQKHLNGEDEVNRQSWVEAINTLLKFKPMDFTFFVADVLFLLRQNEWEWGAFLGDWSFDELSQAITRAENPCAFFTDMLQCGFAPTGNAHVLSDKLRLQPCPSAHQLATIFERVKSVPTWTKFVCLLAVRVCWQIGVYSESSYPQQPTQQPFLYSSSIPPPPMPYVNGQSHTNPVVPISPAPGMMEAANEYMPPKATNDWTGNYNTHGGSYNSNVNNIHANSSNHNFNMYDPTSTPNFQPKYDSRIPEDFETNNTASNHQPKYDSRIPEDCDETEPDIETENIDSSFQAKAVDRNDEDFVAAGILSKLFESSKSQSESGILSTLRESFKGLSESAASHNSPSSVLLPSRIVRSVVDTGGPTLRLPEPPTTHRMPIIDSDSEETPNGGDKANDSMEVDPASCKKETVDSTDNTPRSQSYNQGEIVDSPPHHSSDDMEEDEGPDVHDAHDAHEQETYRRVRPRREAAHAAISDAMAYRDEAAGGGASRGKSKSSRYHCEMCNYSFTRGSDLKRHMTIHGVGKPQYPCTVCNVSFTRKDNLNAHMRRKHNG